jgi:hypothetical protein
MGVCDRLQSSQLLRVVEDDGGEGATVDLAGFDHLGPPSLPPLGKAGPSGCNTSCPMASASMVWTPWRSRNSPHLALTRRQAAAQDPSSVAEHSQDRTVAFDHVGHTRPLGEPCPPHCGHRPMGGSYHRHRLVAGPARCLWSNTCWTWHRRGLCDWHHPDPETWFWRRFGVETICLLGALIVLTAMTLTGGAASAYLLLSMGPPVFATIYGGSAPGSPRGSSPGRCWPW